MNFRFRNLFWTIHTQSILRDLETEPLTVHNESNLKRVAWEVFPLLSVRVSPRTTVAAEASGRDGSIWVWWHHMPHSFLLCVWGLLGHRENHGKCTWGWAGAPPGPAWLAGSTVSSANYPFPLLLEAEHAYRWNPEFSLEPWSLVSTDDLQWPWL